MIEDASGILKPAGTRELIETVRKNCDGLPVEFHMHCTSGLAPLCYLEAMQAGATTLHTAVAPLANGTSLPATETVVRNARRLGYESDLDEDALSAQSDHFRKIAEKEGLPIGAVSEYDLFHFEHQVPGGMMTNLTRQLRELGMAHRLDEILNEVVDVRRELGYPVMATPYSQIVGVQAVENVVSGERYKKIPDATIKYALGYYGEPVIPVDKNVMDRIMNLPRTKEFIDWQAEGFLKSIEDLRQEIGPELSDDELILRILIPGKRSPEKPVVKQGSAPEAEAAPPVPQPFTATESPREYRVEVDGDVFTVRISPLNAEILEETEAAQSHRASKAPEGAIVCDMAGLVLSLEVNKGDSVQKGDLVAVTEAMKMRRPIHASANGTVREIMVAEGDAVEAGDVLMVVR
jgi:pyruvate/oxaloacetate carboxyltransferase